MNEALQSLRVRWNALSPRERRLVSAAMALVLVWAFWSVAIRPAWSVLRSAPAQQAQAQALLDHVQSLAAQSQGLRAAAGAMGATQEAPRTMESGVDDSTRARLVAALGDSARLEAQGRFVTIQFEGVSGEQLRQALQMLRSRLRAQLVEAELAPGEEGIRGRLRFEWTAG